MPLAGRPTRLGLPGIDSRKTDPRGVEGKIEGRQNRFGVRTFELYSVG
jgi:hypothetical protein